MPVLSPTARRGPIHYGSKATVTGVMSASGNNVWFKKKKFTEGNINSAKKAGENRQNLMGQTSNYSVNLCFCGWAVLNNTLTDLPQDLALLWGHGSRLHTRIRSPRIRNRIPPCPRHRSCCPVGVAAPPGSLGTKWCCCPKGGCPAGGSGEEHHCWTCFLRSLDRCSLTWGDLLVLPAGCQSCSLPPRFSQTHQLPRQGSSASSKQL